MSEYTLDKRIEVAERKLAGLCINCGGGKHGVPTDAMPGNFMQYAVQYEKLQVSTKESLCYVCWYEGSWAHIHG